MLSSTIARWSLGVSIALALLGSLAGSVSAQTPPSPTVQQLMGNYADVAYQLRTQAHTLSSIRTDLATVQGWTLQPHRLANGQWMVRPFDPSTGRFITGARVTNPQLASELAIINQARFDSPTAARGAVQGLQDGLVSRAQGIEQAAHRTASQLGQQRQFLRTQINTAVGSPGAANQLLGNYTSVSHQLADSRNLLQGIRADSTALRGIQLRPQTLQNGQVMLRPYDIRNGQFLSHSHFSHPAMNAELQAITRQRFTDAAQAQAQAGTLNAQLARTAGTTEQGLHRSMSQLGQERAVFRRQVEAMAPGGTAPATTGAQVANAGTPRGGPRVPGPQAQAAPQTVTGGTPRAPRTGNAPVNPGAGNPAAATTNAGATTTTAATTNAGNAAGNASRRIPRSGRAPRGGGPTPANAPGATGPAAPGTTAAAADAATDAANGAKASATNAAGEAAKSAMMGWKGVATIGALSGLMSYVTSSGILGTADGQPAKDLGVKFVTTMGGAIGGGFLGSLAAKALSGWAGPLAPALQMGLTFMGSQIGAEAGVGNKVNWGHQLFTGALSTATTMFMVSRGFGLMNWKTILAGVAVGMAADFIYKKMFGDPRAGANRPTTRPQPRIVPNNQASTVDPRAFTSGIDWNTLRTNQAAFAPGGVQVGQPRSAAPGQPGSTPGAPGSTPIGTPAGATPPARGPTNPNGGPNADDVIFAGN